MGSLGSVSDIVAMLWRRRWIMGTTILAGAAISYQVAMSQPHSYAASAILQIETPRSLSEGPRGSGGGIAAGYWLQLVQARLMVRENIETLIRKYDLFADTPQMSDALQVDIVRRAFRIEPMTGGQYYANAEQWPGVLRVTATMSTPELAASMANEMAQSVLDLNANTQSERTRETLEFYSREEARIARQIDAVETEMATFRNENLEILPTTTLDNRPDEMRTIDLELNEISGDLLEARSKLAELTSRGNLATVEQRDARQLESRIELLSARQQQLQERMDDIRASGRRSVNAQAQMDAYQRRLEQLRELQAEMGGRRAAAETAQRLNAEQEGEQFILLEPAIEPDYPLSSGRKKIMVFGLAGSMGLALALALLLELLKPVLRSASQMERSSGLRPVMTIPNIPDKKRG
ncbi:Wzz/FepE/Etk N-terminal domain-containing protein [Paracoccus salsus]|uniref:Wzz/FepE/Etk N-terminal domain-containing protein n=1 Tax=Paracoccus salsus TaxID=2911061 RepID=UPI001F3900A4|nr:Wzz/FepE/Etk N-terminal domain-containing protein [Paracoccus salsus]MCF3972241.1 Wzz/FepE/Etk N-terminal domain-containing protein [Paracoccus salsus]